MLLLAPAAAGKSTLVSRTDGRWLDGDVLISKDIGWPHLKEWWLSDDDWSFRAAHAFIVLMAARHQNVVFNGTIKREWIDEMGVDVLVVIPTESVHKENIAARHKESGADSFPQNWDEAQRNRELLLTFATDNGYALLQGWEADAYLSDGRR